MNEEEYKALIAKVGEDAAKVIKEKMDIAQKALDEKIEALKKANVSKEEIKALEDKLKDAIADANKAAIESVTGVLKTQGEAIGELKLQLKSHKENGKPLSFKQALKEAFEESEVKEQIAEIVKNNGKQKGPLNITVQKAAVTMGEGNTIGSGSTQVTLITNTGIISGIRRREEKYLQAVSVGTITGPRALWIEETDEQGTPIFIAEGAAKIQLSTLWVEKTATVQKIGVFGKVTTELLADLPQLISYIQASLMKRLSVVVENNLLVGPGTGVTLFGAKTLATAFSAGANATAIDDANYFDVLDAIALQVEVANGVPNAVFIHPATWAKMKSLKDTTKAPIWKDYVTPSGDVVYAGMKIITSTAVTAGEFIGGDMEVLHVLYREDMSIQIGLDGSDFTNNLKTILVEERLVQFASANDTPCIVKGTFAAAITALETP